MPLILKFNLAMMCGKKTRSFSIRSWSKRRTDTGPTALTSAVRRVVCTKPISPKTSPGPRFAMCRSILPSTRTTSSVPLTTRNMLRPMVPCTTSRSPSAYSSSSEIRIALRIWYPLMPLNRELCSSAALCRDIARISYNPTSRMRDITNGVIRRFAKIEKSIVAAASAPNCAIRVKSERSSTPNPRARARLTAITGAASSLTVSMTASS